jgi:hypothetical protein
MISAATAQRLFIAGATIGPIVDSLHNQCLLEYHVLPVSIQIPWHQGQIIDRMTTHLTSIVFQSSWTVIPLLGIAYITLGAVLPSLVSRVLDLIQMNLSPQTSELLSVTHATSADFLLHTTTERKNRALMAVGTTVLIVKLSHFLETHASWPDMVFHGSGVSLGHDMSLWQDHAKLLLLSIAVLLQWFILDRSLTSFLVASMAAIGGPLAELPLIANNVWTYLPEASDYYPLEQFDANTVPTLFTPIVTAVLGTDFQHLALSSITGPCYFAVTTDAIALCRWFDSMIPSHDNENEKSLS